MAKTTTPKTGADGEAPAKKSKKKLIIIVVPVLLLVLGVGGYLVLGKSSSKTAAAVKVVAPKPGFVTPLDPITVNLADGHFLKIGMALQGTVAVTAAVDGSMALDLAISLFTNQPVADLTTDVQREKYMAKLTAKVEKAYEKKGYAIYFTSFVMQ